MTWQVYALAVLVFGLLSTLLLYADPAAAGRAAAATRRTPPACHRCCRSTPRSASSPAPTGRPTRGRPQASYLADMVGLVVAQFTAAGGRARGGARRGPRHRRQHAHGSATSGWTSPGRWCGSSSRCRSSARSSWSARARCRTSAASAPPPTLAGGTQQIPGGPGRLDGGHQAARHQRRQHVRRRRRPPVRESHPRSRTSLTCCSSSSLPFAIVFMFGRLIGRRRQALAIVAVMAAIFLAHTMVAMQAELHGNPLLPASVSQVASGVNPGGNMEGKETRFGPVRVRADDRRDHGHHGGRHRLRPRQLHPGRRHGRVRRASCSAR